MPFKNKRACPICQKQLLNLPRHMRNIHKLKGTGLKKKLKKGISKAAKSSAKVLERGAVRAAKKIAKGDIEELALVQDIEKVGKVVGKVGKKAIKKLKSLESLTGVPKAVMKWIKANRKKAREVLLQVQKIQRGGGIGDFGASVGGRFPFAQSGQGAATTLLATLSIAGLSAAAGALIFKEYLLRNPGVVAKLLASALMGSGVVPAGGGRFGPIRGRIDFNPSGNGIGDSMASVGRIQGEGLVLAGQNRMRGRGLMRDEFVIPRRQNKMIRPFQSVKTLRIQKMRL